YILWLVVTNACFALAGRLMRLPWTAIGLGLISPPNLYSIAIGQTGAFISTLLLLGFGLARTNPIAAGIAASLLIVKPQFFILVPICFLAMRNWLALGALSIGTAILCILPAIIFSPSVWQHFLFDQTATARIVLNKPWPQAYQGIMVSTFIMLRSLGAGLNAAYAVQFTVTVTAAGMAAYLWLPRGPLNGHAKLAATLCLAMLATPYGYIYDLPALALVLAALALRPNFPAAVPCAIFWLVTSLYIFISMVSFVIGAIFLLFLAIYLCQPQAARVIIIPHQPRTPPPECLPWLRLHRCLTCLRRCRRHL
ncbi:MAG: glycosyltransferase family 87 protein, partial [Acidocella sp.]|nr:glycosyltransferase family 87 protein [Acidocella sp.]